MKLAIFDCDGTLVDSQNLIVAAMNLAFERQGFAPIPRERVLSIVGLSLPEAMAGLQPEVDAGDSVMLAQAYKDSFTEVRCDPAAREPLYERMGDLVHWLHDHDDVLLAIATGKSRRGVDRVLAMHGLEGRFVAIATADDHPSKPHPQMIVSTLAATGVAPERAVMIGDTSYDMSMARAAGVAAVGVGWGYHPPDDLVRAGARSVAQTTDDLAQDLQQAFALRVWL